MLSDPVGVARGYEQYFGLVEPPFGLNPNRRFLFESESHSAAVEQVTLAIRRREPLVVITGEIGTGKTLLCRTIQAAEPRTFVSITSNPRSSGCDFLRQVLHDFGLVSDQSLASDITEQDFVRTLQQFLSSLAALGAHAIIVIDEAQRLEPDALEQVRLLCSLEAEWQALLQVIMVGRLDLDARLEQPGLRQLAERVSRRHQLQPLKPYEIAPYIERRLSLAQREPGLTSGGQAADALIVARSRRVRFTPVALRTLPALTHGLPRAVNIICDRALNIAFRQNKRVVDAACVIAAARDLKVVVPFELHLRSRWRFHAAAVALLVAAGAGAIALHAYGGFTWATAAAREPAALQRDTAESPVEETPIVAPLPEAEGYLVAAASFGSASRAAEVASSLRLLDLPVFVREVEGSHAVVVGPFASREEAVEAQAQIARVHLTDSRIVSTAPTEGATVHPLRAVATTGEKGQQ
jgi:general secretion pathway protein A